MLAGVFLRHGDEKPEKVEQRHLGSTWQDGQQYGRIETASLDHKHDGDDEEDGREEIILLKMYLFGIRSNSLCASIHEITAAICSIRQPDCS